MGIDVVNSENDTSMYFNHRTWAHMLTLASSSGWEAAGTVDPEYIAYFDPDFDPADWSGSYTVNEGQKVTADDAKALAAALRESLDDIPDFDAINKKKRAGDPMFDPNLQAKTPEELEAAIIAVIEGASSFPSAAEYFSQAGGKQLVRDFANFCEAGAFRIY